VSAETAAPEEPSRQALLVGAVVHGSEVGTLEVLREGDRFLLPVDDLSGLLGVALVQRGETASLATPLGRVVVDPADLQQVEGVLYITGRTLSERLATPVSFDAGRYVLDFDPPWRSAAVGQDASRSTPRIPDIRAPRSTLSGLSGRLTHTRFGDHSNLAGDVGLDGRLARGLWRVRLEDSQTTPFEVREYQWYTRRDRTSFLAGRQRLQLHSTLAGFDLAGLQVAWTNRDAAARPPRLDSNVMASHGARPVESFQGPAPAGSFVRLQIEGRVVETQQVGFSGFYRFEDVALPSRQASEIEILIFDRHNRRVPVEIRRFRLAASNLLLPAGTGIHTGGVGETGTFTEGFFDADPMVPRSTGAFYQWRQGLNARMTGETAIQHAAGRTQAYTGLISRLGRAWILGLGLSRTEGAIGHSASLEGYGSRWRLYARSTSRPAEFELAGVGLDRADHVAEWFHDTLPRLKLGLTARSRDDGTERSRYILPSVAWHPVRSFHLDLRPDIYGDYQGNVGWAASEATRATLFVAQTSHLEVTHDLDPRYRLGFDSSFGGGFDERYTLSVARRALSLRGWAFRAGLVSTEHRLGYLLAANTPVLPGFHLQAEYQSIPFRSFATDESLGRLLISISTDLSHVGGRFLPARSTQGIREEGSMAGRIVVDPAVEQALQGESWARDLGGIRIVVDRRVRTRTDSAGRFYVGSLPPGVYSVELDTENLPIQFSPVRERHLVEVGSGAVTRVDFPVRLQLGMAGRVIGEAGVPIADVAVEVLDGRGARAAATRTDRFGLYRVDGLPPGSYLVRATIGSVDGSERVVERAANLATDFLFEQDLAPDAPALRVETSDPAGRDPRHPL
jgi:hypothetical protein